MRAISTVSMLDLPVRLRGVQVATPVDLLFGAGEWRAIGFEVVCGDGERRFLPFATVRVQDDELAIGSTLMMFDELDFYRARSRSFRSLLGSPLELDGEAVELRDARVERDGTVSELLVGAAGSERWVEPDGSQRRAAA